MFNLGKDSKDIALLALVGLGLYSQSNELNLANNTTVLLILFLLYSEHEKIEGLKHEAYYSHKEIQDLKCETCFGHKDLQDLKREVGCVENLTNTRVCNRCDQCNQCNQCNQYNNQFNYYRNRYYENRAEELRNPRNRCYFA